MKKIKIVDPACGSGAFLIQALEYLKEEYRWIYFELDRVRGYSELWETDTVTKEIIGNNLYGVDINPESVEIAKLALWMHTALPGKKLSNLDDNIKCGNSLVGKDFSSFYQNKHSTLFDEIDENEKERINAFDWESAFPTVFKQGGFDCVIGNPPYVKLQNFRRVEADVAEYLVEAKKADGTPLYHSTQPGNFDLYLPFIEKGVSLLKPEGKMGYIAPNVWMVNEYGKSLRNWFKANQKLDRWIDFKSFQVFSEATTYTALQFFNGSLNDEIRCVFAKDGDISGIDWSEPDANISLNELPSNEAWNLLPNYCIRLIKRLNYDFSSLEAYTSNICVGIQTSANDVYHLRQIDESHFYPIGNETEIVELETSLVHPLVKGPDIKRYITPTSELSILVPYKSDKGTSQLISKFEFETKYSKTWQYLKKHEVFLRSRENSKMDKDNGWWGYNYPKNIDKQHLPRLLIAGTATGIRIAGDFSGKYTQDDRRVFAIIPYQSNTMYFLLGILNSPVPEYIFKMIARPKVNGFYDIEQQFLAPLPIPYATKEEQNNIGNSAKLLQELHTKRLTLTEKISRRLQSSQMIDMMHKPHWLWADVKSAAEWAKSAEAPSGLKGKELTTWAKKMAIETLLNHLDELDALLKPGALLTVENTDDELRFLINGKQVIELYDKKDTPFIAAQWRQIARSTNVTEKFFAKKLISKLLSLRSTKDDSLKNAVVSLDAEVQELDQKIVTAEDELNQIIFQLYKLTPEEIELVMKG